MKVISIATLLTAVALSNHAVSQESVLPSSETQSLLQGLEIELEAAKKLASNPPSYFPSVPTDDVLIAGWGDNYNDPFGNVWAPVEMAQRADDYVALLSNDEKEKLFDKYSGKLEETNATFLVQISPDASGSDIQEFLDKTGSKLIEVFDSLGQIVVLSDISGYLEDENPDSDDATIGSPEFRAAMTASQTFSEIPGINFAVPNAAFIPAPQSSVALNAEYESYEKIIEDEQQDWGLDNIGVRAAWDKPNAYDGTIVGVFDVGFAKHEDIVFTRFPKVATPSNHGNHVSGIACAGHNGKGIIGVVPNCFVQAVVPTFSDSGVVFTTYLDARLYAITDIQRAFNSFLQDNNHIKTVNLSMGINWAKGLEISNPDLQDNATYRADVALLGNLFRSVLELAERNDTVIFTAAGNDSMGLDDPVDAKYASPFNWAIFKEAEGGRRSGIVVEAHDENNQRAPFSNEHGMLSCPGVRVTSAFGRTSASYGVDSGTSMATPYCAGAHALLVLVMPEYSAIEIANCMVETAIPKDTGAPRLNISAVLENCQS